MAEAPKDAKKDSKPEKKSGEEKRAELYGELFALLFIFFVIGKIFGFFNAQGGAGGIGGSGGFSFQSFFDSTGLTNLFNSTISLYIFFISILSTLFIMGIVYCLLRLSVLEKVWKEMINPSIVEVADQKPKNTRWQRVVAHISSDNSSDWRLAILECDIILDELLDHLGYIGGTIGDKLKNANTAHFRTLNMAWEAHKIRNAIAHEGQDFTLTQREARRIVGLYETVFREFDFI